MVINRIFKKGKNAVIEFESGDSISVSIEIALKSGLRKNDFVDEDRIKKILNEDALFRIKNSAFRVLSRRLHTKKELFDKLILKEYPENLVKTILSELESKGYIDDLLYTRKYIEENGIKKGASWQKIKFDLIKKGVERSVAEYELKTNYTDEVSINNVKKLIEKKMEQLKGKTLSPLELKQKIFQSLLFKGYSSSVISTALRMINKEF